MAAAVSPSSSPRLPSPPPIAEDQVGPTSPGLPLFDDQKFPGVSGADNSASRRIRPGTRSEDIADGPPLVDLQDIDSAFQLTEHLKALYNTYIHPDGSDTTKPINADIAKQLTQPPANTSKDIWLYELGRFLIQKTNAIIVALFSDQPPCSAQTCPEMRASEWQYLCAVHDPPKSCAAIDYCCHTLDGAATTLTSSKMFPSRLGLGSGGSSDGASGFGLGGNASGASDKVLMQQMREIKNIFRRVYRIYAHAWFQHREMFWRVESKTGLYVFFKMVCDEYGIIESENYTIPPEAEGAEPTPTPTQTNAQAPSILKRDPEAGNNTAAAAAAADPTGATAMPTKEQDETPGPAGHTVLSRGDTTKRHRPTVSGSGSISTVIQEEVEEEEQGDKEQEPPPPVPIQSLGRSPTALRDFGEPITTTTEVKAEDDEDEDETNADESDSQASIITRSDTLKPLHSDEAAPETLPDATVVEIGAGENEAPGEAQVSLAEEQIPDALPAVEPLPREGGDSEAPA